MRKTERRQQTNTRERERRGDSEREREREREREHNTTNLENLNEKQQLLNAESATIVIMN